MKKVPQPFMSFFVLLTDEHNKRAKTAILKIVFRANKQTYCAAFCASVALLAGSGNSANCKWFRNGWKERRTVIRYEWMSLGWFSSTSAKMNFSGISLFGEQRGSLSYIFSGLLIWMQFVKWLWGENVSSHWNFHYTAGKRGVGNLQVKFVRKKLNPQVNNKLL